MAHPFCLVALLTGSVQLDSNDSIYGIVCQKLALVVVHANGVRVCTAKCDRSRSGLIRGVAGGEAYFQLSGLGRGGF